MNLKYKRQVLKIIPTTTRSLEGRIWKSHWDRVVPPRIFSHNRDLGPAIGKYIITLPFFSEISKSRWFIDAQILNIALAPPSQNQSIEAPAQHPPL